MGKSHIGNWLIDLIIGRVAERRWRVISMLLTMPAYLVAIGVALYAMSLDLVDRQDGRVFIAYVAVNFTGFYLALRLGWHLRRADPDMALERSLLGMIGVAAVYAWCSVMRSNALLMLSVILVLGLFSLPPRQIVLVGFLGVGLLGAIVAFDAYRYPGRYPLRLELLQFGVAACCLPATAIIAKQVQQLRKRLQSQKQELREALERVEHLAQRDPLTGLVNRRYMQELATQELGRQERGHGSPCAVAIVDLDWFKRINDTYGHAVGDQVLKGLANEAQAQLRPCDVLSRWGGEEFLLLLPRTSARQARRALTRFGGVLSQACLVPSQPLLRVSASIGLAQHEPGETLDQVLERADRALYRAKQEGRNRVVVAESAPARAQALAAEPALAAEQRS